MLHPLRIVSDFYTTSTVATLWRSNNLADTFAYNNYDSIFPLLMTYFHAFLFACDLSL